MRRALIEKGILRLSVPGVDVDNAKGDEFILHEDHLSAQPYYTEFISCPYAGITSSDRSATVDLSVPAITDSTMILYYLVFTNGGGFYPLPPSHTSTGEMTNSNANLIVISPTSIQIGMGTRAQSPAPKGVILSFFSSLVG